MMNRFQKTRLFHAKAGAKGGRRADLGNRYFRSKWEANTSRWLNELKKRGDILDWAYEDREFAFPNIKRGSRFYRPDFRVVEKDREYFIEVKGLMLRKDITLLKRMAKYYPEVLLLVLDKPRYAELESEFGHIEGWES